MTEVPRPHLTAHDPDHGGPALTDTELIASVRAGDAGAFEELFLRHRDVAIRYARRIADQERAEDLCAEAFTKILDLLQRGKGPDVAFRAYLLTTVRTSHLNTLRTGNREELVPDHEPIGRMVPVSDDPDGRFDRSAICRAYLQLPERWQAVLWLTEVEGFNHDQVSEHLAIKPNAVASLAFRARAGLRQAYLAEHLLTTTDPVCRKIIEQLPSYFRERLSPRRRTIVDDHLAGCLACAAAALEVSEVDDRLGALIVPLALSGFAASGAATATHTAGLLTTLKGWGTATAGAVGTKAAAAVAVAAVSVAVGAEVTTHHPGPHRAPRGETVITVESPVDGSRSLPHARPASPRVRASITPAPTPPAVNPSAAPPLVAGPAGHPSTARPPSAAPSETPSPSPTAPAPSPSTSPPATAPRSMAVGSPSTTSYQSSGWRWEQVDVPVSNPTPGTLLVVTTNRTYDVARASTTGTGWTCGVPTTTWFDGGFYESTRIACSFNGGGNGMPLRFDYRVARGAVFTAQLTPPSGYSGGSATETLVTLSLRS